jgi:hypothetical protein
MSVILCAFMAYCSIKQWDVSLRNFSSKDPSVLRIAILVLLVIEELELGLKGVRLDSVTWAYKFHDSASLIQC